VRHNPADLEKILLGRKLVKTAKPKPAMAAKNAGGAQ